MSVVASSDIGSRLTTSSEIGSWFTKLSEIGAWFTMPSEIGIRFAKSSKIGSKCSDGMRSVNRNCSKLCWKSASVTDVSVMRFGVAPLWVNKDLRKAVFSMKSMYCSRANGSCGASSSNLARNVSSYTSGNDKFKSQSQR